MATSKKYLITLYHVKCLETIDYLEKNKDKTALVISAGPTLDRNIETIKKYRDNVVIFTVGTALKTLIKNDIKPDLIHLHVLHEDPAVPCLALVSGECA
mgnify:CR=1 FL=1